MARVALGLIALHVVDDAFLQPEPGTSASDHLVSGLVPLALLAWVAVAYGHARAGVRGGAGARHRLLRRPHRHRGGVLLVPRHDVRRRLHRDRCADRRPRLARRRRRDALALSPYGRPPAPSVPPPRRDRRRRRGHDPVRPAAHGDRPRGHAHGAGGGSDPEAGRTAREGRVHDERRSAAAGLVRPVAERRDRDRVPGSLRSRRSTRACSSATATASCSSTVAARA